MKITKKALIAAVAGTAGAGLVATSAMAATSNTNISPLAQKIADTYHLSASDVQGTIKDFRNSQQTDRQAKLKAKLDQAVKDGKLTQSQEDSLIAELKKLHDQRQSDNQTDRQAEHQKIKNELDQWAKDNGISNLDQILPAPNGPHGPAH